MIIFYLMIPEDRRRSYITSGSYYEFIRRFKVTCMLNTSNFAIIYICHLYQQSKAFYINCRNTQPIRSPSLSHPLLLQNTHTHTHINTRTHPLTHILSHTLTHTEDHQISTVYKYKSLYMSLTSD